MHLSKKTIEAIIDSDNGYLVKVKRNQPYLYEEIERQAENTQAVKTYKNEEKTRNRYTIRETFVFDVPKNLEPLWKDAASVIERYGIRGNELFSSISYYLCSLP